MKTKIIISLVSITLLSASCTVFSTPIIAGIQRTSNGGADWQLSTAVKGNAKANINPYNIVKMEFDPTNQQIVFAGSTNGGLLKSEDSGQTWSRILSNITLYDFVIVPADPKTIYAAGEFNGHGRLVITKDGGASWTQIFDDGSQDNPVRTVALNPSNPSQVAIGMGSGNIIRSSDGGLSWQAVKDFGDRINHMLWQNDSLYILVRDRGLFKVTDMQASAEATTTAIRSATSTTSTVIATSTVFTDLSAGLKTIQMPNAYNDGSSLFYNQFYVDPNNQFTIYIASSRGLFKTIDEGKTWANIPLPIKATDSLTRTIAVSPSSNNLVFTSIGSTIYKSTDSGFTWQTQRVATNGSINYILIDPQLPQIVYAGIYGTDQ